SQRANGVSQLHGVVSRHMFGGLWPGFDDREVPIASITNGVHAPTWADRKLVELAERHLGSTLDEDALHRVSEIPGSDLWSCRRDLRAQLVTEARRRVRSSWLKRGATRAELGWT